MPEPMEREPLQALKSRDFVAVDGGESSPITRHGALAGPAFASRRCAPWAAGAAAMLVLLGAAGCVLAGRSARSNSLRSSEAGTSPGSSVLLEGAGGCPAAPLHDFYMYRAQTDEDYEPVNQDMANIGGCLWYLHNEIIWHHYLRVGSFSSIPKTRIERWRVKTRATCTLNALGMNFGVVNEYDLGKCTGPFKCENLDHYGPVVGCEAWSEGQDNHFPHKQWMGQVKYPNAAWYSLPGACHSEKFWGKTHSCDAKEPGGACKYGDEPTGAFDCTYTYEKVGEISIDDLEGIPNFSALMKSGGYEYSRSTDKGKKMHFWDDKDSPEANQRRINRVLEKFKETYPEQPDLKDPLCDFDRLKFYPNFPKGTFS